jgi:hypothetical protein
LATSPKAASVATSTLSTSERQHCAGAWPRVDGHCCAHVPHQQVRVEVLVAEFTHPTDTPGGEHLVVAST